MDTGTAAIAKFSVRYSSRRSLQPSAIGSFRSLMKTPSPLTSTSATIQKKQKLFLNPEEILKQNKIN
jgi:hypothetical protein